MSSSLIRPDVSSAINLTDAWETAMQKRVANRAGFKAAGASTFVKKSYGTKLSQFMAGSRSDAVVAKARMEAGHYVQAAMLRQQYEIKRTGFAGKSMEEAVINSKGVKNRVYRQDYIRYRGAFFSAGNNAESKNKISYRLARVGHIFNGLTDIAAAPTGFTQKFGLGLVAPTAHEKSNTNKLHMGITLLPIGLALTAATSHLKAAFEIGVIGAVQQVTTASVGILIALPVVSSICGLLGLGASAASQLSMSHADLGAKERKVIVQEHNELIKKLDRLLLGIRSGGMGQEMTIKALNRKIGSSYRNEDGTPEVLEKLLAVANHPNQTQTQRLHAISNAIGEYLHVEGYDPDNAEGKGPFAQYGLSKQAVTRERHFVALCDLVEHSEVQKNSDGNQLGLRKQGEVAAGKYGHKGLLKTLSFASNALIHRPTVRKAQTKIDSWIKKADLKVSEAYYSNPANARENRYSGRSILEKHYQYGRVTVGLARTSEFLKRFSIDVVLARNAQLSRIFFNGFFYLNRLVSTDPASRVVCFHAGRFAGGAALTALWGIGIFTGLELAGVDPSQVSTIFSAGSGPLVKLSYIATGVMMAAVMAPSMIFMGAAQIAARIEGWKGDIERPAPKPNANAFSWDSRPAEPLYKKPSLLTKAPPKYLQLNS